MIVFPKGSVTGDSLRIYCQENHMIVIPEGLVSDVIQRKYVQYQVIVIYCALSSRHFLGTFSQLSRDHVRVI